MIGWIVGILVIIIILSIILKKMNKKDYKPKSRLGEFLKKCCSHRK